MSVGYDFEKSISVVVAFLPSEISLLTKLFYDLSLAPYPIELVLSCPQDFAEFHNSLKPESAQVFNEFLMKEGNRFEYIFSDRGRAEQFNQGVEKANSNYVWLLHVDSRLSPSLWTDLALAISRYHDEPDRAFYFGLKFFDGPLLLKWNSSWGNFRAKYFGMIYGDQGFLMQRNSYLALGGFSSELKYGEDHEFVWRSKASSMIWKRIEAELDTSGRAYHSNWLFKSLERIYYGIKQMLPLAFKNLLSIKKDFPYELIKSYQANVIRDSLGARTAVVVFVKTPGLSPLKTRLGKGIGKQKAENFHLVSCKKIENELYRAKKDFAYHVFWGVAEVEALSKGVWSRFPRLLQSEGGLGDRLSSMYQELIGDFDNVIFIGADCPQLKLEDLNTAVKNLDTDCSYYIGKADDGGYYLFAGNREVPEEVWLGVTYSVDDTAAQFQKALEPHGKVKCSSTYYSDVDTIVEYGKVLSEIYPKLSQHNDHIVQSDINH